MMKGKERQALLKFSLAAFGYIPQQTDEDYVPRIKDRHVDVNKIISVETKCE